MEILKLFRQTIKYGKRFASINRVQLLMSVHEFYYNNKFITDEEELKEKIEMAYNIHANFRMHYYKSFEVRGENYVFVDP